MGTIILNTEVNAPNFCFEVIHKESGRTKFFQSDWDYPGVAREFGWRLSEVQTDESRRTGFHCTHDSTDGTVACRECGAQPSDFMSAALDFIRDHDGAEAEDPGYFDEEDSQ